MSVTFGITGLADSTPETRVVSRRATIATALGAVALLGMACAARREEDLPKPLHVSGKVRCAEPIAWPSGATARVALVEVAGDGDTGVPLAEATVHPEGTKPADFELQAARGASDRARRLGITVRVTDREGKLRWITAKPYMLSAKARPRDLVIVASRAEGIQASSGATRSIVFECEGSRFKAQVKPDVARVDLPNRRLEIRRVWSAPGEEYRGGGASLRIEGDAVRFDVNGRYYRICTVVPL